MGNSLDVPPKLYMLVFGESVLNDAVSVVLFRTFVDMKEESVTVDSLLSFVLTFTKSLTGSVLLGTAVGLVSALVFKYSMLHKYPSLEMSLVFIFAYFPYLLAEGCNLSGITAILFTGIVMAHYTHNNLSPLSQVTTQQSFRMFAFLAETFVFAYLGLAVFAFQHRWHIMLIAVSLVLCIVGRICNIFPLSRLLESAGVDKIDNKTQFVMCFSGLRGAVAFALALNAPSRNSNLMVTTTLAVVLFSIFVFGGGTLPLLRYLDINSEVDYTPVSTASTPEADQAPPAGTGWFERLDAEFLSPLFVRVLEKEEDLGTELSLAGDSVEPVSSPLMSAEHAGRDLENELSLDGNDDGGAFGNKLTTVLNPMAAQQDATVSNDSSWNASFETAVPSTASVSVDWSASFEAPGGGGLDTSFPPMPASMSATIDPKVEAIDSIMSSLEESLTPSHSDKPQPKSVELSKEQSGMQKEFKF